MNDLPPRRGSRGIWGPAQIARELGELRTDARLLGQAATRALHKAWRSPSALEAVWLSSFVALGAVDAAALCRLGPGAGRALAALGLAGGTGLLVTSARDMDRAAEPFDRLDAASDVAWAGQALLTLSSHPAARASSLTLGVLGATAQTTVGALRVRRGMREHDMAVVKLGLLDLGGGLLWLGWDLIGWSQPLFIGSYVVLMIGREAYAKKEGVQDLAAKLGQRTRGALDELARDVRTACGDAGELIHALERLAPGGVDPRRR